MSDGLRCLRCSADIQHCYCTPKQLEEFDTERVKAIHAQLRAILDLHVAHHNHVVQVARREGLLAEQNKTKP